MKKSIIWYKQKKKKLKELKNKNLKKIKNKSLVEHSIDFAKKVAKYLALKYGLFVGISAGAK